MHLSDFQSINISSLRKFINFESEIEQKVNIEYGETSGVDVTFDLIAGKKCIIIDYAFGKNPYKQIIALTSTPSNILQGKVYYFRCSVTGVRCRKLHFIKGRFVHRSGEAEYLYELQALSKKRRAVARKASALAKLQNDHPYDRLYAKHFPRTYRGVPTKRAMRLNKELEKLLSEGEIKKVG